MFSRTVTLFLFILFILERNIYLIDKFSYSLVPHCEHHHNVETCEAVNKMKE